MRPTSRADINRWQSRPLLGQAVAAAALFGPIVASCATAFALARIVPRPSGTADSIGWLLGVLAVSSAVLFGSERVLRRVLPLAALLKMTLLFPDRAPSRLRVAVRAGSTRDLERRFRAGVSEEPAQAAAEILALAAALSNHDRSTRGHSERVRVLTEMLAEELDLPAGARDRLRWASLLHDAGKLTVDRSVLSKSTALSPAEWDVLRRHPLEGARLVAPLAPWLGEWGLAVAQHHERFDGSGYPFGLRGEEISLAARIVSVADAFEVMTARRSYKDAVSPSAARAELTRCAGTQFDPEIVRAFLAISLRRLGLAIGAASWLAEAPLAEWAANLGRVAVASGHVAVATAAVVATAVAASPSAAGARRPPESATAPVAARATLAARRGELVATLRRAAGEKPRYGAGHDALHPPTHPSGSAAESHAPAGAATSAAAGGTTRSTATATGGAPPSGGVAPRAVTTGAPAPADSGKGGAVPGRGAGPAPGGAGQPLPRGRAHEGRQGPPGPLPAAARPRASVPREGAGKQTAASHEMSTPHTGTVATAHGQGVHHANPSGAGASGTASAPRAPRSSASGAPQDSGAGAAHAGQAAPGAGRAGTGARGATGTGTRGATGAPTGTANTGATPRPATNSTPVTTDAPGPIVASATDTASASGAGTGPSPGNAGGIALPPGAGTTTPTPPAPPASPAALTPSDGSPPNGVVPADASSSGAPAAPTSVPAPAPAPAPSSAAAAPRAAAAPGAPGASGAGNAAGASGR